MKVLFIIILFLFHCKFDKGLSISNYIPYALSLKIESTISGNVIGLPNSESIELKSFDEILTVSKNGKFIFSKILSSGEKYSVSILKQPSKGTCEIKNNSGTMSNTPVTNVEVICKSPTESFSVGGEIFQLNGTITIQINSNETLTTTVNGSFKFLSLIKTGENYSVKVISEPSLQTCIINNSTGVMGTTDITNVKITCAGNALGPLVSGTILSPISFTNGVTTLVGKNFCNPNSTCTGFGNSGFTDSTDPTMVQFDDLRGLATDGNFLYLVDHDNSRIRKINSTTGATTTLAGNGINARIDGIGTSASFENPEYIATDGANIYVADQSNNSIRKIEIVSGIVTTLVTNSTNLAGIRGMVYHQDKLYYVSHSLNTVTELDLSTLSFTTRVTIGSWSARGITIAGNEIFIADSANNDCIHRVTIGVWIRSNFVGCANSGFVDGTGTAARFNDPEGITTDGTSLFVSDYSNNSIRRVNISTGAVTTLAGSNTSNYVNSSTFTSARFTNPTGIAFDGYALYVSDRTNEAIRRIR